MYLFKGIVHCILNYFFTIYITLDTPIDKDGSMDCLWYTSVDLYTNILFIVSIDLIIDTANITWINVVIQLGTTFGFYIIFLCAVHFTPTFNSYASIYNSVNSPILWLNLIFVFSACFLFDYSMKSINFIFKPNYANELQIVYNRYGPINSTKKLSERIIEILQKNNFEENEIEEDKVIRKETDQKERKKKLKNKNDIEIHSISISGDINKDV